jgi:hypothetical protein
MVKKGTTLRVSDDFALYVRQTKEQMQSKTGKKVTDMDITDWIAHFKPQIIIPIKNKKQASIFDF